MQILSPILGIKSHIPLFWTKKTFYQKKVIIIIF